MNENATTQAAGKPLGLILTAIYTGISAAIAVLSGAGATFAGAAAGGLAPSWMPILGFVLLLFGVLEFAAAYGLWVLVPWGHSVARIIYIASIPLGLLALLADKTTGNAIRRWCSILAYCRSGPSLATVGERAWQ